ncbi:MAG: PorT family protein [Bacteroidaceae bacterium]|nr:PorT family protein [Bacteroidaceae bacterium]MBQ8223800.1 PorT family protein [Bacteroides sp.]
MRNVVMLILLLLFVSPLRAQQTEEAKKRTETTINYGARVGFNSSLFLISDFSFGNVNIDEVQNNYKIGYFGSIFMRINFDRHFLQPELTYSISRCNITFDKPQAEATAEGTPSQVASINSSIHSVDLPILYGYNIINEKPYGLAIFGGPKLRYILTHPSKITYNNFSLNNIREELHKLNAGFTLGVAVTISPIFFDFRYDIGLHNLSKHVAFDTEEIVTPIKFQRRDNVLSFSLGVLF